MFSGRKLWMNPRNPALWISSLRAQRDFRVVSGRSSAFSRFAPAFHSEIRCRPIGLTLVGVLRVGYSRLSLAISERIDTVWRDWHRLQDGNRGFWGTRCRQVVSIPLDGVNAAERCRYLGARVRARGRGWVWPGGLRTRPWFALALRPPAAGLDAEAGPRASTTPKYGHLLPTCRPRATMAA